MSVHLTIYYLLGSIGPFVLGAAWSAAGWSGAALLAALALGIALVLTLLLRRSAPGPIAQKPEADPVLS